MSVVLSRARSVRRIATLAAALALTAGMTVAIGTPAFASTRVTYAGSRPAWAKSANDTGAASDDATIESELALPLQNEAGAEALAAAVSTPGSAAFHHYVAPAAWIAKYAPTKRELADVIGYLKSQGFTISAVPASREFVVFRGTAAQLGDTFDVAIHRYTYRGHTLLAPSSTPSLPSSIASSVKSVSIDQGRALTQPSSQTVATSAKTAATSSAASAPTVTCSDYYGQNTVTYPKAYGTTKFLTDICGYTPKQIRAMYGLSNGPSGAGQTIGIVDAYASPSIVRDVNTYSKSVGEPGLTSATYSQMVSPLSSFNDVDLCAGTADWQGEQTLDVESAHGIAPQAKIIYSGGFNCDGGIDIALSRFLDNKVTDIVSNSYSYLGEDVGEEPIVNNLHQEWQAAAEGIGLYYSSGDEGDNTSEGIAASPDFPASTPWVTAVGGTSVGLSKNGKVVMETGYGDNRDKVVTAASGTLSYAEPVPGDFYDGAGGGTSSVFAEPSYQRGVVPSSLSGGARTVPDISALASPYTGFLIGISPINDDSTLSTDPYENETYGGTSLASPITAAEVAITQQVTHSDLGFANPVLYKVDKTNPSIFRDVVPSATPIAVAAFSNGLQSDVLVTLGKDSSLAVRKGYDTVTGIGSLDFPSWKKVMK
jgi:subtilase family serine protease